MILKNNLILNKVLITIFFLICFKILFINCQNKKSNKYGGEPLDKEIFEKDYQKSLQISKNVTRILDQLLKGYDKRLRPNYAGPPVVIGITININNINSISEVNMDYTMEIFLRQMWTDKRLSFDGVSELLIGSDMLHKIWLPDTYIANDRKTYFHKATVQNKFIRIKPDGQVLYSMRLTVTAACPMSFHYFPMDHQECDLEIESYGFRMEDIQYKWAGGMNSSLDVITTIELPQLKYTDYRLIERQFRLSTGLYSRLTLKLYFLRSLGYYITQIYIPATLIVVLSWVSFWLDRTAAPARVSLGITTVLTMVTFIWSTNASLPKISYVKSIDVFLVCCFFMTFSSVIEYAMVSYIHLRHERKKRKQREKLNEIQRQSQLYQQLMLLSRNNSQINNSLNNELLPSLLFRNLDSENTNDTESMQNYDPYKRTKSININLNNYKQNVNQSLLNHINNNNMNKYNNANATKKNNYLNVNNTIDHDNSCHCNSNNNNNNLKVATPNHSHCNHVSNGVDTQMFIEHDSPLIWEKKYDNDTSTIEDEPDGRKLPIFIERPRVCSCSCQHTTGGNKRQMDASNPTNNRQQQQVPRLILKNSQVPIITTASTSKQHCNSNHHNQQQPQPNNHQVEKIHRPRSCVSLVLEKRDNQTQRNSPTDMLNLSQTQLKPSNSLNLSFLGSLPLANGNQNLLSNSPSLLQNTTKKKKSFCRFKIKACTIDNYSRVIFPVVFFVFHIIYWTHYLRVSSQVSQKQKENI